MSSTDYQHQLRLEFPDIPEWWNDWNWVYNKPEALANIDYKMRQWEKGDGGKKFKAQFGERYTNLRFKSTDAGLAAVGAGKAQFDE